LKFSKKCLPWNNKLIQNWKLIVVLTEEGVQMPHLIVFGLWEEFWTFLEDHSRWILPILGEVSAQRQWQYEGKYFIFEQWNMKTMLTCIQLAKSSRTSTMIVEEVLK